MKLTIRMALSGKSPSYILHGVGNSRSFPTIFFAQRRRKVASPTNVVAYCHGLRTPTARTRVAIRSLRSLLLPCTPTAGHAPPTDLCARHHGPRTRTARTRVVNRPRRSRPRFPHSYGETSRCQPTSRSTSSVDGSSCQHPTPSLTATVLAQRRRLALPDDLAACCLLQRSTHSDESSCYIPISSLTVTFLRAQDVCIA